MSWMKLCKTFSKKISINLCVCKNSHQQSSYSYLESFWELLESFRHGLGKNLCLISDQKKKSVANSWDFVNRSQVVPFHENKEIGLIESSVWNPILPKALVLFSIKRYHDWQNPTVLQSLKMVFFICEYHKEIWTK